MSLGETRPDSTDDGDQVRLAGGVGVELRGINLADISDGELAIIRQAFDEHSGLLFRGQRLTAQQLVAFSARLGELDHAPVNENGRSIVEGMPELYVVSNIKGNDGKPIGSLGAGEAVWHTDMSYLANPPDASLLYAIEIPPAGGDTWLAGMYAVLDDMPPDLRRRIAGRRIKHDGTYNSAGYVRAGLTPSDDPMTAAGTFHPAICRHPGSGREVLYLGRRRNAYVEGLELADSETLLDGLWAHATQQKYTYAHQWQVGDVLMWDNRATLH
ncbi:MAG TPA: TauD/TfdA family dioxygenase, partial [Hyphomicrobiaceae bacterium]|nr:TauD/TfdA family dioxygenase [Hyphomicrobiaceae bacterium]